VVIIIGGVFGAVWRERHLRPASTSTAAGIAEAEAARKV
jgi:hypothetical protein